MELLILSRDDVRELLDPDELLTNLAEGFVALSEGRVVCPGRRELSIPQAGFLMMMPAWMPGSPMAIKLVTVFHGNHQLGLPGHQALVCLFDPATGTPLALMDGTAIMATRTAACSALSVRLLARKDARVLTIIGAGVQGQSHLHIIPRVRGFTEIRIASYYYMDAQKLASMNPAARAVESFQEAVSGADVVCLCTNSGIPVIDAEWISPGAHLSSVGYFPPGGELPLEVFRHGRLFVETRRAFEPPPIGCGELAGLDPARGTELGEILSGKLPGRLAEDEMTIFKSMGHGLEDLVAANLVYKKAIHKGLGVRVKL